MTLRQLLLLGALAAGSPALGQLTLPSPSEPSAPPTAPAQPPGQSPGQSPGKSPEVRPPQGQVEIDLRPKFTRGSIFRLRMETSSESESFMPGLSIDDLNKPASNKPANKQITSKPKTSSGKTAKPAKPGARPQRSPSRRPHRCGRARRFEHGVPGLHARVQDQERR